MRVDFLYTLSSLLGLAPSSQVCPSNLAVPLPVVAHEAAWTRARAALPSALVTAFVDVNVIPLDTERVRRNQTVLVEDGLITAMGPAHQVKVPAGAVRIDGRGKYLMPGLTDMHTHFGLDTPEGAFHLLRFAARGVWRPLGVRGCGLHQCSIA